MKKSMICVAVLAWSIGACVAATGDSKVSNYLAELVDLLNVSGTWQGAPLAGQMDVPGQQSR